MEAHEAFDLKAYPTCKICDRGTLMPRKIHRLSGPAVAIGYILLIPSILGMAACAILLVIGLLAGFAGAAHGSAFATAFAGVATIALVYIGIFCFVSGLLGWLLIMKKHILQCVYCGAIVDAAAAVYSHPNRSFGRARVFGIFFLFLIFIAVAVGLFHNDYRTWTSGGRSLFDWTEFEKRWQIHTDTGPAQPAPDNSTAEPTQPAPNNSIAEPAQPPAKTGVVDIKIVEGVCDSAQSLIAERPAGASMMKRISPFSCDSASFMFYDTHNHHVLIEFAKKNGIPVQILGFAGNFENGTTMSLDHVYLESEKAIVVHSGECLLDFEDQHLKKINCGVIFDQDQGTGAIVVFNAAPGQ
ncbi:MAG: hypothetical protein ABSC48_05995 [Terracidiphilus sp.]|jgi:hypothetical protein